MDRLPIFILLLCLPSLNAAFELPYSSFWRRAQVPSTGYYDPKDTGGSMLTKVIGTFPEGQGEPINAIISANSDSTCWWIGRPTVASATISLNETAVIRYNYGDASLGACTETIKGGNHFRYWVQNGDSENSGAIFMAFSYEMPISLGHDIVVNGYNTARDYMVGNITGSAIPTLNLTNSSTYSGSTSYEGYTYKTDVKYVSGLLDNTSIGINHNWSVYIDGVTNAVDGLVAVLDVSITERPDTDNAFTLNTAMISWLPLAFIASLISLVPL
ncbi:hypothetical protein CPB85DRAFT_1315897 [Mucidula mucida]|nr:hypothetical protein CPB85DRAFT_1315897 [Mucidula mucida]